jgi:glyoxylase I family protein
VNTTIPTTSVNHLALTVTDLSRSERFYTGLLGFQKLMDLSATRVLLANSGGAVLALTTAPDPSLAPPSDRFNENRVGLDHLSFSVADYATMVDAARLLDQNGVPHGEIKDLTGLKLYVMALRDPDNIQLELTAPYPG